MRDLIENVIDWANDKGIFDVGNKERQTLKMVEEVGEFVKEVLRHDKLKARMEMGDILVTLIITGRMMGIDIEDALEDAYHKISKRTGQTINGVFVKDN